MEKTLVSSTTEANGVTSSGKVSPKSSFDFPISSSLPDTSPLYQQEPFLHRDSRFDEVVQTFQQGLDHHQHGDFKAASDIYHKILSATPLHAGAWHYLGVIALSEKKIQESLYWIGRSVQLGRPNAVFMNNYGVALCEAGKDKEGLQLFQQATSLNPNYVDAWSNLGKVQLKKRLFSSAKQSLQNAIRLDSNHLESHLHLIDLLQETKHWHDAVALCKHLLEKNSILKPVLEKLGHLYLQKQKSDEALPVFHKLASLEPTNINAALEIGRLYGDLGHWEESRNHFKSLALSKSSHRLLNWKYLECCPAVFDDMESIDRYWDLLSGDLDDLLSENIFMDWRTVASIGVLPSFHLTHHGKCCREIREKFASIYKTSFPHERPKSKPGKKIRVGFFTSPGNEDGLFRGTLGIIQRLNPERFEPIILCSELSLRRCRQVLAGTKIKLAVYPNHFENASRAVRALGCDILYYWKVESETWNPFFAMTKPAPVQCTSWGTLGTSGIREIDYYLTSPYMEPENGDFHHHYTENVVVLHSFPMYQNREELPQDVQRSEFGFGENDTIYFCPHRTAKYHPSFDEMFKRILEHDGGGKLVLKVNELESTATEKLKNRLTKNLGNHLMKRVLWMGHLSYRNYRRLFSTATVVLDSPVYTGGYTAYDAFSLGVPIVTLQGKIGVQTFTSGFYRKLGMPEMVNRSLESYVKMALRLGKDADYRESISKEILSRCDVLYHDSSVVDEFERFFENAVRKEGFDE